MSNLTRAFFRWKEVTLISLLVRAALILYTSLNLKSENIFYPWVRWDGLHYIEIAKNWYQSLGQQALFIVFYPLYPILIKITTFLTHDFLISSILIPLFFSLTSSIILFELTLLDFSKKTAFLAVWFLNIFPTSYFLQASYTESLFLTVSMLTVYFFRKNLFINSGLFGSLSTLTRVNGILLLPLLIMESKSFGNNTLSFLLLPFGSLLYITINFLTFGDPFYFTKSLSTNWFKHFEWPWLGIGSLIKSVPHYTDKDFYIYFSEVVALFFILIMTFYTFLRIRKSYGVYILLNFLIFTSTSFILSTPRYILSLFPIFIALGTLKNKFLLLILSVVFIIALFKLTLMYTQGRWAF